jgi:hypothetical protein
LPCCRCCSSDAAAGYPGGWFFFVSRIFTTFHPGYDWRLHSSEYSSIDDLEKAIGQYVVYRAVLTEREPNRVLYLAVPQDVLWDIFEEPLGQLLLKDNLTRVIGFDPLAEVIVKWLP